MSAVAALLPVLLLLASFPLRAAVFFESDPACGFNSTGFLDLINNANYPEYSNLGVCDWGFDVTGLLEADGDGNVGNCVGCRFVPTTSPCPANFIASSDTTVWQLYPISACAWSTGCLDQPCLSGSYEAESAMCGSDGQRARRCCPPRPHRMCCRSLPCVGNANPGGECVVGTKDLLPGQSFPSPVYAVPAASSLCAPYSFVTNRTCLDNRTFTQGNYYEDCSSVKSSKDANGCVIAPGFELLPNNFMAYPSESVLDDGTTWGLLPASARAAAAGDITLMATRCAQSRLCAAFDTSDSANLRSYIPTLERWSRNSSSTDPCKGTYVRSLLLSVCPRVPGYLFKPMVTSLNASVLCSDCFDADVLAARCTASSSCAGFSNMHGLLLTGTDSFPEYDQRLQFTTSPCMGMYERITPALPTEVETIDTLLCGGKDYCSEAMEYSAQVVPSSKGLEYAADIVISIRTSLILPSSLTLPNSDTVTTLPALPRVRSLIIRCLDGSALLGGLPKPLFVVFPNLQQLDMSSCRLLDTLPEEWNLLTELRVLDLSDNLLSGGLPSAWQSLRLGFLNLSSNVLTGELSEGWLDIVNVDAAPQGELAPAGAAMTVLASSMGKDLLPADKLQRSSLLIADLSGNELTAPIIRPFVQTACFDHDILLWFRPSVAATSVYDDASLATSQKLGQQPFWVFFGNIAIQSWAGDYLYAQGKGSYNNQDHGDNMCGSYHYIIVISVLWGCFFILLTSIVIWWRWRTWRLKFAIPPSRPASGEGMRSIQQSASTESSDSGEDHSRQLPSSTPSPDGKKVLATDDSSAGVEVLPATASIGTKKLDDSLLAGIEEKGSMWERVDVWFDIWWPKTWVRRCIFLARLTILVVDIALDISVAVWLADDGSRAESIVCIVFIALAQFSVAIGVFCTFVPLLFGSMFKMLVLSPIMIAVAPVVAPVLAVWNVFVPDVPIVFWRYLELVEFSVMLLQAPAESITQTIIYARQNVIANGMYLNHGLFLASIVFSLADMLISVYKLLRYKHGPWHRVRVAFTHLDKTRDMLVYQTDFSYYTNFRPGEDPDNLRNSHNHPLLIDAARKAGNAAGVGLELSSPNPRRPFSAEKNSWGGSNLTRNNLRSRTSMLQQSSERMSGASVQDPGVMLMTPRNRSASSGSAPPTNRRSGKTMGHSSASTELYNQFPGWGAALGMSPPQQGVHPPRMPHVDHGSSPLRFSSSAADRGSGYYQLQSTNEAALRALDDPVPSSPAAAATAASEAQAHAALAARLGLSRLYVNPAADPIASSSKPQPSWGEDDEFGDIASAGKGTGTGIGSEVVAGLVRRVGSSSTPTKPVGPVNYANTPKWGLSRPPKWPGNQSGMGASSAGASLSPYRTSTPPGESQRGESWRPSSVQESTSKPIWLKPEKSISSRVSEPPPSSSQPIWLQPNPLSSEDSESETPLQSLRIQNSFTSATPSQTPVLPWKAQHAGPSGRLRVQAASSELEPAEPGASPFRPSTVASSSRPSTVVPSFRPSAVASSPRPSTVNSLLSPPNRVLTIPKALPSSNGLGFSSLPYSPSATTALPFSPSAGALASSSAAPGSMSLNDLHNVLASEGSTGGNAMRLQSQSPLSRPTTSRAGPRPRSRQAPGEGASTSGPYTSSDSPLQSAGSSGQLSGRRFSPIPDGRDKDGKT